MKWSALACVVLFAVCLLCNGCNIDNAKESFVNKKNDKVAQNAPEEKKAATGATGADKLSPAVKLITSKGEIVIELDEKNAPISTKNFLAYVEAGYYDGTVFHRVIKDFMLQGGGFTSGTDGVLQEKKSGQPIKNEADNGLRNLRGTISMARTQVVDSATSQFFLNLKDNAFLDHGSRDFGYAVFGKVTDGLAVMDEIAKVKTTTRGYYDDVPAEPVVITKAVRLR